MSQTDGSVFRGMGGADEPPSAATDWRLAGQLLIATPVLVSAPFAQSVVLMCAHSLEEGAMGVVINRPVEQPDFDGLLAQLGVQPAPPRRRIELCSGGPMDQSRGLVLHSAEWTGEGSLLIDDALSLTASLDVLRALAEGNGPARALLALGHASWGPGQLEREMEENAWVSAPATDAIVFDTRHETKWRRALHSLRIDPIMLSAVAGHA